MERLGFSEFHRHWASERAKRALVVDLRGNSGGHISELLLPRLAHRASGFEVARMGTPLMFPEGSAGGPVVLIVDQTSCSDAEMAAQVAAPKTLNPKTLKP
jgi:tricorn protease